MTAWNRRCRNLPSGTALSLYDNRIIITVSPEDVMYVYKIHILALPPLIALYVASSPGPTQISNFWAGPWDQATLYVVSCPDSDIRLIPRASLAYCRHSCELITNLRLEKVLCHRVEVITISGAATTDCFLKRDWLSPNSSWKSSQLNEARGIG